MNSWVWNGREAPHSSRPETLQLGRVSVGLYGGTGGKNEDGALIWEGADWVFAVVVDAHSSSESTDLILDVLTNVREEMLPLLEGNQSSDFVNLQRTVLGLLTSPNIQERFAQVKGEASCLICYQRGRFLTWMSVGDNSLYVLHPDLERLGQHTLTVRNFYEWVGARNSLALDVPCFASGTREMRQGEQIIALVTDGLLEVDTLPFNEPAKFSTEIRKGDLQAALRGMLDEVQRHQGRDSATVVAWKVHCEVQGLLPTS